MTTDNLSTIELRFHPHPGQRKVLNERKRFNTLNLGRRWGKTYLGVFLLIEKALDKDRPLPVAWFSPTYKDLTQVWKKVKKKLAPIITFKNEQTKQLEVNGVVIDFWSLDDPDNGRGRKYGRVLIDEVAKVKSSKFKEAWEQSIRATLADYKGDAYFLSTPKGFDNYWHKMCKMEGNGWKNFNMPTWTNPYILKSEIEELRQTLPPLIFSQEYEASFQNLNSERWFFEWQESFIMNEEIDIDATAPLYLSIDFNVSPCTAIVFQVFTDEEGGIYVLDEVEAEGGTRGLMEKLKVYLKHPMMIFATGDSTGNNKNSAALMTNWQIVTEALEMSESQLIDTTGVNPQHETSRALTAIAMNLGLIYINKRCTNLINGIRKAVPDRNNKLHKDDSDVTSHFVDTFRYAVHSQCPQGRNSLIAMKRIITKAKQNNE